MNPDNTPKKPHYHVILTYSGPTSYNVVKALTDGFNQPIPQALEQVRARDDWQIFRDITLLLGGNPALKDFNSALDILTAMSTEYGALNAVSWGSIGDGGQPILETGVTIPVVEREKNQGR